MAEIFRILLNVGGILPAARQRNGHSPDRRIFGACALATVAPSQFYVAPLSGAGVYPLKKN